MDTVFNAAFCLEEKPHARGKRIDDDDDDNYDADELGAVVVEGEEEDDSDHTVDTVSLVEEIHTPTHSGASRQSTAASAVAPSHPPATPISRRDRYLDLDMDLNLVLEDALEKRLAASVSAEASAAYYELQQQQQHQQQHYTPYHDMDANHAAFQTAETTDSFVSAVPSFASPPQSSYSPYQSSSHATNLTGTSDIWTVGTVNGICPPGDKPKRPLSAYNFFFQLERARIVGINTTTDIHDDITTLENAPVKAYTVEDVVRVALLKQQKLNDHQPKEKRSHRKTHGKISFGDLARTIAHRWKRLDETSKSIFDGSASLEKERYRRELAEWTLHQKKWKEAASKMTASMRQQSQQQQFPPLPAVHHGSRPPLQCTVAYGQPQQQSNHDIHNSSDDECVVVTPSKSPVSKATSQARKDAIAAAMLSQQSMVRDSPNSGSSVRARGFQNSLKVGAAASANDRPQRRQSAMDCFPSQHHHLSSSTSSRRSSMGTMMTASSRYNPSESLAKSYQQQLPYVTSLDEDDHHHHHHSMDYDDLANETYNKVHMMLPEQQQQLRPSNGTYQAMLNQRRMRMMSMMQQRQQQMTMAVNLNGSLSSALKQQQFAIQQQQRMDMRRRMHQNGSDMRKMDMLFGGIEQSIQQEEQQRQMLMEQMAEISGNGHMNASLMEAAFLNQSLLSDSHHGANHNSNFDNDVEQNSHLHSQLDPSHHHLQHQQPHAQSQLSTTDEYHPFPHEDEAFD